MLRPLLHALRWLPVCYLMIALPVQAQKPNPKAPTITSVTPNGAQPGARLEITLAGTNLASPTGIWSSFPAKISIPTDKNNGKSATSLRVVVEMPKDAPLGFQTLRLATTTGMSNALLFCIDDLPPVAESGNNHSKSGAQKVPAPCVVMATADKEQNDYFQIEVKAGQRISFETIGRRLGSDFDPQISLFEASTGRELPRAHNNDAPGLQTDARLTHVFEKAGSYVVQVRDVTYRGAANYRYRLRIGDFPCATTTYPHAAKRGGKATVGFTGTMIEDVPPVTVDVPDDPSVDVVWVTPKGKNGLSGWPVPLMASDHAPTIEKEPNDDQKQATRITAPGGACGRFLKKAEKDHFVFAAKKGQRWIIEAQTFELGSPTEVYFSVRDAKGKQLAVSDPAKAPRVTFNVPADGDYLIAAEHLHYWAGPTESYHLSITPAQADFGIALALDRFEAQPGKTVSIPILATRSGYNDGIEVSVIGNAALSGSVTIPKGQPKKPNTAGATLKVTVKAGTPPGPISFKIQGKAMIGGESVIRYATVRATVDQMTANLPYPPPQFLTQLGLAVKP